MSVSIEPPDYNPTILNYKRDPYVHCGPLKKADIASSLCSWCLRVACLEGALCIMSRNTRLPWRSYLHLPIMCTWHKQNDPTLCKQHAWTNEWGGPPSKSIPRHRQCLGPAPRCPDNGCALRPLSLRHSPLTPQGSQKSLIWYLSRMAFLQKRVLKLSV